MEIYLWRFLRRPHESFKVLELEKLETNLYLYNALKRKSTKNFRTFSLERHRLAMRVSSIADVEITMYTWKFSFPSDM